MRYLYRCDCGWDDIREQPMDEPVPEVWTDYGEHPSGYWPDGSYSRTLCYSELRRVYEPSLLNLGYREGLHGDPVRDSIEHYRFKHLAKD